MGILIKNFTHGRLTLKNAYAKLNSGQVNVTVSGAQVIFSIYSSLEARIEGLPPVAEIPVTLTNTDLQAMPIWKAAYEKLKDLFPEFETMKEAIETTQAPKIVSSSWDPEKRLLTVTGTMGEHDDELFVHPDGEVTREGKNFTAVVNTRSIKIYAKRPNCFRSLIITPPLT